MTTTSLLTCIRELDVSWYGAAAGAAAAGAALVPDHRILAGLLAGAAVLALGMSRKKSGACCAECAGRPATDGGTDETVGGLLDFSQLFGGTRATTTSAPCGGTK